MTGGIDWDQRLLLMRTHTALHILCGVVWRDYGAKVTGGDMRPGEARMDFEVAVFENGDVGKCAADVNPNDGFCHIGRLPLRSDCRERERWPVLAEFKIPLKKPTAVRAKPAEIHK